MITEERMKTVQYDPTTIKNLIARRGLNPVDAAARTNGKVGKSAIYDMQKGQYGRTQMVKLEAVAKALSVPVKDLNK